MNHKPPEELPESNEVGALYGEYKRERAGHSAKVDVVMARLLEAGLVGDASSDEVSSESLDEQYLNRTYSEYRRTRAEDHESRIDALMEQMTPVDIQATTKEVRASEQPDSLVLEPKNQSLPGKLFLLPAKLIDQLSEWLSGNFALPFPKVAVPVAAVAVLMVAVAPLILKNFSDRGTNPDIQLVSYSPPESLLHSSNNYVRGVDLDPGFATAMSGSSSDTSFAFQLGQRLLETKIVNETATVSGPIVNIVGRKLELLSDRFENADMKVAISTLAESIAQPSIDPKAINTAILEIEKIGEMSGIISWMSFGEATEALNITSKMYKTGVNQTFKEALSGFSKQKFESALEPPLSEAGAAIVEQLNTISLSEDSSEPIAKQVNVLVQQLVLTVI